MNTKKGWNKDETIYYYIAPDGTPASMTREEFIRLANVVKIWSRWDQELTAKNEKRTQLLRVLLKRTTLKLNSQHQKLVSGVRVCEKVARQIGHEFKSP